MGWTDDFMPLAEWALRSQDLKHKYLFCQRPVELNAAPGIAWVLEVAAALSIYEAAVGKGYIDEKTIGWEKSYPAVRKRRKKKTNPKRADLAFKNPGKGQNWAYLEIKYYGSNGKFWVQRDINKLKTITLKSQRWIFTYRVRATEGKGKPLKELLEKNFNGQIRVHSFVSFPTYDNSWSAGVCDLCLSRVL